MKIKHVISAATIMGALVLSGCTFSSTTATAIKYDPSDGVSGESGNLAIRNALVVHEEGISNIVFTAVNNAEKTQNLNIELEIDNKTFKENIKVEPGLHSYGSEKKHIVAFETPDLVAGQNVPIYFQSGNSGGAKLNTPVLDDTLKEYKDYVISPSEAEKLLKKK